jgi:CDGSH-type Zn-finger protein
VNAKGEPRIRVSLNGPYVVTGGVPISRQVIGVDEAGNSREWRETHPYDAPSEYLRCRCGNSRNKPFFDDGHLLGGVDGSESPGARVPYADLAREFDGPERLLTDARPLCRLIAWNRHTAEAFEREFEPSMAVVEDPAHGVCPLWVRGGIQIESAADGHVYERRNRLTLCRCGQSSNKPFCGGTHAEIGFRDGSPELEAMPA